MEEILKEDNIEENTRTLLTENFELKINNSNNDITFFFLIITQHCTKSSNSKLKMIEYFSSKIRNNNVSQEILSEILKVLSTKQNFELISQITLSNWIDKVIFFLYNKNLFYFFSCN